MLARIATRPKRMAILLLTGITLVVLVYAGGTELIWVAAAVVLLTLFLLLLASPGIVIFFITRMWRCRDTVVPFTDAPLGHEEFALVYDRSDTVLAWRRRGRRLRFRTLPSISLFVVLLLLVIWIPWSAMGTSGEKGLTLAPLQTPACMKTIRGQTVVIRVKTETSSGRPALLLNGVRVAQPDFPERLRRALETTDPQCPVYVEGDPDLPYQTIVDVLDVIQEQGSDAVLTLSR